MHTRRNEALERLMGAERQAPLAYLHDDCLVTRSKIAQAISAKVSLLASMASRFEEPVSENLQTNEIHTFIAHPIEDAHGPCWLYCVDESPEGVAAATALAVEMMKGR